MIKKIVIYSMIMLLQYFILFSDYNFASSGDFLVEEEHVEVVVDETLYELKISEEEIPLEDFEIEIPGAEIEEEVVSEEIVEDTTEATGEQSVEESTIEESTIPTQEIEVESLEVLEQLDEQPSEFIEEVRLEEIIEEHAGECSRSSVGCEIIFQEENSLVEVTLYETVESDILSKNDFTVKKNEPLGDDSRGDEYVTNSDLYLASGKTDTHVVMKTDLGTTRMNVSMPPELVVKGKKEKQQEYRIKAPRKVDIDGGEVSISEKMTDIYGIFHVGDENDTLSFERGGKIFPVEISYASEDLLDVEEGSAVLIYSSQDGENRTYHSDGVVIYTDGMGMVTFETTHMTYFYVGSIRGHFEINNDDITTQVSNVTLNMDIIGATEMRFGNTITERDSASWESYTSTKSRVLSGTEGAKTVYAQFRDGVTTVDSSDDIIRDSTPPVLPFTGGLTLWYDAAELGSLTVGTEGVTEWADQSGNGYDALQPNALDNQPDYGIDPLLGESVVTFNGIDDYLAIETLHYDNTTALDGILVCAVFSSSYDDSTSYSSNWSFLDYDRSEFFNMYLEGDGDVGLSYSSSAGGITDNSGNGSYNDGNWHVACSSFDGNAVNDTVISVDGTVIFNQNRVANGTVLSDATTRYGFIGEGSEAGSFNAGRNSIYYEGSLAEVVYYEGAKTALERQELECYLGEKRGVTITGCASDTTPPIATVAYSIETDTSGYVIATLTNYSESITITNNGGSNAYVFDTNSSFTFEYEDSAGNTGSTVATVGWIQSPPPTTNQAPEITSYGGTGSVTVPVLSGATAVGTITATDNMHNVIGQFGDAVLTGSGTETITHAEICEPVVVVSHRQEVSAETARAPRVVAKNGTGFDVKVDNYDSSLSAAAVTPIDYVVLGSGTHNFGGMDVEVGSRLVSNVACSAGGTYDGTSVTFASPFDDEPAVLHTVSSNTDTSWVVSHVNGDGTAGSEPETNEMHLALQRSFNSCTHGAETIDYMAFEQGHTSFTGGHTIDAVVSDDDIECCTAGGYPISYDTPFAAVPETALVAQLGEDGGNGGYGVIHEGTALTTTELYASVDEDGPGADRGHTNEPFAAVTFSSDSGLFFEDNLIVYSLTGDDSALFTISTDGQLEFITGKSPESPEDADGNNIYEVTVEVCDTHCNSQCETQEISVIIGGEICIDIPESPVLLGSYPSSSTGTIITQQLSGYFSVEDTKGSLSGWYTTLEIPSFSGSFYGDELGNSVFEWKAGSVDLLGGSANTGVVLDVSRGSFTVATGTVTFLEREAGINSGITGTYGALLDMRLTIPPYTRADTYNAKIVYTLYEN